MENFSLNDSRTLLALSVGISMIIVGVGIGAAIEQIPIGGLIGLLLGVAVIFFLMPTEGQTCTPSDNEEDDNADDDSYELVWNDDDSKYDCLPTACLSGYELNSSNVCVAEETVINSTPTKLSGDTCTTYTGPTLTSTANVLSYQLDSNLACNVVVCDTANGYVFNSETLACEVPPALDCTTLTSADTEYQTATADWSTSSTNKVRDFVEDVSLGICVANTCIGDNFLYNGVCYPTTFDSQRLVSTTGNKADSVLKILKDSAGAFMGDVVCNTGNGYFYNDAGACQCDLGYGFTTDTALGSCTVFNVSNIAYENLELVAYQYLGSNATAVLSNIYIAREDANNEVIFELLDNVNYSNLYIGTGKRIDISNESMEVTLSDKTGDTQQVLEDNGKVGLLHINGIYDPDNLLDTLSNVFVESGLIQYDVDGDANNYVNVTFASAGTVYSINDLEIDEIDSDSFVSFTMSYPDTSGTVITTIDTKEKAIVLFQYLSALGYPFSS